MDDLLLDGTLPILNPRPHLLFRGARMHLRGLVATPRHLAPECDRASRQRPTDSLGRFKSNGVRVDTSHQLGVGGAKVGGEAATPTE